MPAPGFMTCPLCMVQVQRTEHGDIIDGLEAHYRVCHPDDSIASDR